MTSSATSSDPIDDNAAFWAARRISGDFTDADEARLNAWLASDPRHRRSFDAYLDLTELTARAADLRPREDVRPPSSALRAIRSGWAPALAAGLALCVAGVLLFAPKAPSPERHATAIGEIRDIPLPDGSSVQLNSNSSLTVRYSKNLRSIELERGEAFFEVAPNPERPFTVATAEALAQVVGTRFAVRDTHDGAVVTVLSGAVDVSPLNGARKSALRLGPEDIAVVKAGATLRQEGADARRMLAWREGALIYRNEPLGDVVDDLNRYLSTPLSLKSERLKTIPVTARVRIGDERAIVDGLDAALSLNVELEQGRYSLNADETE